MGIAIGLEAMRAPDGSTVVLFPGWPFRMITTITLVTGTVFLMWLGEKITEKGIGNGISLIIFAGIVASLPTATINTYNLFRSGEIELITLLGVLLLILVITAAIVFMEISNRRIPIQYVRRSISFGASKPATSYLPLK